MRSARRMRRLLIVLGVVTVCAIPAISASGSASFDHHFTVAVARSPDRATCRNGQVPAQGLCFSMPRRHRRERVGRLWWGMRKALSAGKSRCRDPLPPLGSDRRIRATSERPATSVATTVAVRTWLVATHDFNGVAGKVWSSATASRRSSSSTSRARRRTWRRAVTSPAGSRARRQRL